MADWYAQNSSVNIDSVNEWNADPAGAGAWLTWPAASGDNLYANGKTAIACNVNFNIGTGKISTEAGAGTAGGGAGFGTHVLGNWRSSSRVQIHIVESSGSG